MVSWVELNSTDVSPASVTSGDRKGPMITYSKGIDMQTAAIIAVAAFGIAYLFAHHRKGA